MDRGERFEVQYFQTFFSFNKSLKVPLSSSTTYNNICGKLWFKFPFESLWGFVATFQHGTSIFFLLGKQWKHFKFCFLNAYLSNCISSFGVFFVWYGFCKLLQMSISSLFWVLFICTLIVDWSISWTNMRVQGRL